MPPTLNSKKVPQSVLVFGAGGRVGSQVARFLLERQPATRLRLATTSESKVLELNKKFPSSEVVVADYFKESSLHTAVDGMEAVLVVTYGTIDELTAMGNLVKALKQSGDSLVHLVRLLGVFPGLNPRLIPEYLKAHGYCLPIQSSIAKDVLDQSMLPVTYLNTGATFFQNFLWMKRALKEDHKLVWPTRLVPYMDVEEVSEIAALLLLSPDHRHIGQFHTINNGTDMLRVEDVAQIMTRVWQETITADTTRDGFFKEYTHLPESRREYLWDFFKFEQDNEVAWSLNDAAERIMGRKPKTLEQWLAENKSAILD